MEGLPKEENQIQPIMVTSENAAAIYEKYSQ
jgi:hypothetical protein